MKKCSNCNNDYPRENFSANQWKRPNGKCQSCVESTAPPPPPPKVPQVPVVRTDVPSVPQPIQPQVNLNWGKKVEPVAPVPLAPILTQVPIQPNPPGKKKQKKEKIPKADNGEIKNDDKSNKKDDRKNRPNPFMDINDLVSICHTNKQSQYPTRSSQLTNYKGTMQLETNHFKLKITNLPTMFYHYDLTITYDTRRGKRVDDLREKQSLPLIQAYSKILNIYCFYDGKKNILTAQEIPLTSYITNFKFKQEDNESEMEYEIKVSLAQKITTADYSKLTKCSPPPLFMNLLNLIINHSNKLSFVHYGNRFYTEGIENTGRSDNSLGYGSMLVRGFSQGVYFTNEGFTLNIGLHNSVFLEPIRVHEYASLYLQRYNEENPVERCKDNRSRLQNYQIMELNKELRTYQTIFLLDGITKPRHGLRVKKITNLTPRETFFMFEEKKKSIEDYFFEKYKYRLKYPGLPCVEVGSKGNLYPMETLKIAKNQRRNRKVNEDQQRKMIDITKLSPNETKKEILTIINKSKIIQPNDQSVLTSQITVDRSMTRVKGYLLNSPGIEAGRGNRLQSNGWNYQNAQFYKPSSVNSWVVINYGGPRFDFVGDSLMNVARQSGMQCNNIVKVFGKRNDNLSRLFEEAMKNKPTIIIVVIGRKDTELYREIKQLGDIQYNIPTQVIVGSKPKGDRDMRYFSNVMLKINCKLGGVCHHVISKESSFISTNKIMVMGADVTHPSAGSSLSSISGVVGTEDINGNVYGCQWNNQKSRQEMIDKMDEMCEKLMRSYKTNVGQAKSVLFFRDGVSDGQLSELLDKEIPQVQKAMNKIFGYECYLTYIVVGKRHHTKFFITNNRDGDRNGNVNAGTIVFDGVTRPDLNDFYLYSYNSLAGTSKPTRYVILYDDNNYSTDQLSYFSYELCYYYQKATRSVSIPAPAYYAHHVCTRGRVLTLNENGDGSSVTSGDSIEKTDISIPYEYSKVQYYM